MGVENRNMHREVQRPEAILFDLGSTLLCDSCSGPLNTRLRSLLEKETFAPFVEKELDLPTAIADAVEAVYRDGMEEFHVKKWLESSELLRGLNPSESPEAIERLIRSKVLSYSPPEDARRVLGEFIQLGIPMGVVSNSIFSSDLLRSDLAEHSILDAFRFVISSAEFGMRKPHSSIFEYAVEKLNVAAEATWYVGDLWENDVIGSHGAGLIPMWLNDSVSSSGVSVSHLRVRNWTELGEILGV
ncbi:MAG: hypothetical protein CBC93_06200 [Gammaproteobacteria bacterium TMED133]|nr:MAG: hypothetical protein CBC93_06200 [Gammaproteobacteria bacterium TMED133]